MISKPPTLPLDYAAPVTFDDLVQSLRLIHHATSPTPDDGGHHEAAYELADAVLKRLDSPKG